LNLPVGIFSYFLARKVLSESKESQAGPMPDALTVALLAFGMGSVTLAIVQSNKWGWLNGRTIGAFAVGLALIAIFILRARSIPNPVLHLGLFNNRDFRWANVAAFVFAIGFNAMFMSNVLFLTNVWGYSILRAGLAIGLGPAIVALTAPRFGKLAGRIGQRAILIPGGILYAIGGTMLLLLVDTQPHYLTHYFPTVIFTALGVSMCLPQFSSAAAATLPADQYAAGSAVTQATRYLGGSFGVAAVIAFTSGHTGLKGFQHGWMLIASVGVVVALASSRLTRRKVAA
jgi:Na+/melibiose symporter-like transporter